MEPEQMIWQEAGTTRSELDSVDDVPSSPSQAQNPNQTHANKRGKHSGRKRTKVSLACDICRDRKVRCNGVKPMCGECKRRGFPESQCVYSTVSNSRRNDSQREYTQALHERIRQLEEGRARLIEILNDGDNRARGAPIADQTGPTLITPSSMGGVSLGGTHTSVVSQTTPQTAGATTARVDKDGEGSTADNAPGLSADVEEGNQVDAMGAFCATSAPSSTERDSIFGQSSLVSLMSQMAQGSRGENHSTPSWPHEKSKIPRRAIVPAKRIRRFSLPPRRDADQLLDHFWKSVHLFYPWIHFPSFLKAYDQIWTREGANFETRELPRVGLGGHGCSEAVFHCALNAIFALGCEVADSLKPEDEQAATEFMDRVDELFQISLLDGECLSVVQTLLLIAIYLQSTQHPMKCWGIAGLAIRMAQGIGLHRNHTYARYTFVEAELRRRVWHGCLLMDRIVSMTLGHLPALTHSGRIPIFSAIDDEYLGTSSQDSQQPADTVSRVAFAVGNVKLGEILCEILLQVYGHHDENESLTEPPSRPNKAKDISFDSLVALEASLATFEESLPAALRWKNPELSDDKLTRSLLRQRMVLQARATHARLMLYRPLLAERRRNQASCRREKNMRTSFASNCADDCFEAAADLIHILHKTILKDLFGAWWYGTFFLVSACVILIMVETSPAFRGKFDEGRMAELWRSSHEIQDYLTMRRPMAGRYAAGLQAMRQRALDVYQRDLACGRRDVDVSAAAPGNQVPTDTWMVPLAAESDTSPRLESHWIFEAPFHDPMFNHDDQDWLEFGNSDADPDFVSMVQGLQNSFGGAFLPCSVWHGMDQGATAVMTSLSGT